jgi:phosphoribosyl 1,2-cyclic phosphodiesterase
MYDGQKVAVEEIAKHADTAMHFSVLASGSSGNASLLECGGFGVLIDIGLGPKQLAARLADVAASWRRIDAVLLTHIHTDHWNERSLTHLLRRGITLYCHIEHRGRLRAASPAFADLLAAGLVHTYAPDEELALGPDLCCRPVLISHDAGATCGFRFECAPDFFGETWVLGYMADLGTWDVSLAQTFANVDALALEFNHDVHLELNSGRTPDLIARVLGDTGHLSNAQAAALVRAILRHSEPGRLQDLVQLHLSHECNRARLARAAALEALAGHGTRVHVARQSRPGPSFALGAPRRRRRGRFRTRKTVPSFSHQPWFPGWE